MSNSVTPWTILCQASLSMRFTKQKYLPGVGSHSLLQEIFLAQGLNPGPLHCRQVLYHLSHQGSPNLGKPEYLRVVSSEGKGKAGLKLNRD